MKQVVTPIFFVGLMTLCGACGSSDKKDNQPPLTAPTNPDPKPDSYTIDVGEWSFLYTMPADAFTLDEAANGLVAEDLEGFTRVAETGETITMGGSFRHQPCADLDGVINVGTIDLKLDNPLRYGVSIQQNRRNDLYTFRVLAAFEYDEGKECVSFTFHSREPYTKEINFYAPSELRKAVLLSLNSVAKKTQ